MKKIHKQVIRSQATAVRLALKQIENCKTPSETRGTPDRDDAFQLYSDNNRRFMHLPKALSAMSDGKLAKLYRGMYTSAAPGDSHRTLCPNWAPWYHGNVFSCKEAFEQYYKDGTIKPY